MAKSIQAVTAYVNAPISNVDTEIVVRWLNDIYWTQVRMTGEVLYATIEPKSATNQEITSFTEIIVIDENTLRLTGCTRWLKAQPDEITGLYDADPALAKSHSANVEIILSNNPQFYDGLATRDEDEVIPGDWDFTGHPTTTQPITGTGIANKDFVENIAIAGAPDASTTVKGLARLSESPNVSLGAVTITIAWPAVFSLASHGLTVNDSVQFTTTGTLPTGLSLLTNYYVIATGLTSGQFQVSTTLWGAAVWTSGSQSGTHTVIKTTPVAVSPNDTFRVLTQNEKNALGGTSWTALSGSNKVVDNADTSATPSAGKVVRFGADASLGATQIVDTTYPAWETLSAGNVVFIENAPTTAQATSAQNIGDVTANTRVSFPVFGSGVAASTLALNLAKTGSPSVNLWVRIETDNAGSPSGTLVNANASGTVTAASLTTSLADTTVTLAGSITIPAGQKCHIVTYQGTYWSETVNASNYYKIGYYTNDTSTRNIKRYNWSIWTDGTASSVSDSANFTNNDGSTWTAPYWYRIYAKIGSYLISVTKSSACTATRALLKNDAWTTLSTATFSWNTATFADPSYMSTSTYYRIEVDSSGASYSWRTQYSGGLPVNATNVNFTSGSQNGSWTTDLAKYNIESVVTISENYKAFPYTSSSLFQPRVLSKTDADYSYKIDWHGITQEAVTAWDLTSSKFPKIAIEWVDSNQTSLTPPSPSKTTYYLSNTPWAISASAGTNSKKIGAAISETKIQLYPIPL